MGTRSRIAIMHGNNAKSVYCHWDGYLEHNGMILNTHYNDSVKTNYLISQGDMSTLAKNIDAPEDLVHTFNTPVEDTCVFYGRDRKESNTEFKTDTTFEAFFDRCVGCCAEWYYVMNDGVWYCGNTYKSDSRFYKKLVPLSEALESVKEPA